MTSLPNSRFGENREVESIKPHLLSARIFSCSSAEPDLFSGHRSPRIQNDCAGANIKNCATSQHLGGSAG